MSQPCCRASPGQHLRGYRRRDPKCGKSGSSASSLPSARPGALHTPTYPGVPQAWRLLGLPSCGQWRIMILKSSSGCIMQQFSVAWRREGGKGKLKWPGAPTEASASINTPMSPYPKHTCEIFTATILVGEAHKLRKFSKEVVKIPKGQRTSRVEVGHPLNPGVYLMQLKF